MSPNPAIASTAEIVAELKAGRMVVLVDEEDRENEGDLVMAAEHVTAEAINFMAKHGRGLICLTLTEARCKKLGLTQMARNNKTQYGTAFTVSIEAAEGVTTGISAADRARTIQVAVAKASTADDIVQPGHVFPITAREGGVLVRAGHTEAGCDLAQMAGLEPASVICEIMNDDGTMSSMVVFLATATWMVRARSAAEMPVVTPVAASTLTVKAVLWPSRLRRVICGRSSCSVRSAVSGAQISPRPWMAMKLTISGVQSEAAPMRSASFSRSGLSAQITMRPAAISAMISSIGLNEISGSVMA